MKSPNNIFSKVFAATGLMLLLLSGQVEAQAPFEGSLSYAIRLSGRNAKELMQNNPANILDMHIKDDNFIVHLSGGRIPRTFLFIGDSNHTYVVDAANLRYYRRTYYVEDTTQAPPVAKPTGKTVVIKGYQCQEYKALRRKEKTTIFYYVSDAVKIDTAAYDGMDKAKADFLTQGLGGRIPLRKIIKSPTLTTEVDLRKITPRKLDKENFMIPKGFKRRIRDPRK